MVKIMGIVNVTPDSFSDGGEFLDPEAAYAHGMELLEEGADLLDVGGESTRPGAPAVPAGEELERVLPVVERLADAGATVSIDTSKAVVADAALGAGAAIVNDVTALGDPDMAAVCASHGAGLVLMHMLGTPRTMQENPTYRDVVGEVRDLLAERRRTAVDAGVGEERIWLDPGIGFGKTVDHNLQLIAGLPQLAKLGRPILVGVSRKSFLGKLSGREVDERLGAGIAANVACVAAGAEILRVHDVAATSEAMKVTAAILGGDRGGKVSV